MTKPSDGEPRATAQTGAPTISVSDFCQLLGISRQTYYLHVKEGRLPRAQNGIPRALAQAYLDAKVAEAAALAKKLSPAASSDAESGA